ncbi:hypothetical protein VTL71DRAFT_13269 [Oculimacula yallundae]|uniref:Uncharacterized protein n=1 Tax=Oculimacula yallundae TaxID=86028 RepID=A0ABR4CK14_9HELO
MRYSGLFCLTQIIAIAFAQTVVPFVLDGSLDDLSIDSVTNNTGGTISLLGHTITVPTNLVVQFPATWVSFKEFAAAKSDLIGCEVVVTGNFFIAGGGSGIIERVGFDGTVKIAGGPLLRINTPSGIFATPYTNRPIFTADEGNSNIISFFGYPMCIPRSSADPLCPTNNRPTRSRVLNQNRRRYLCYSIVAENVQILTAGDSGDPVYLRVEDVIIAVSDGSPNVEFAETRFIGYISDSSATVSVYALDVDPCTGQETERQVAAGTLKLSQKQHENIASKPTKEQSKVGKVFKPDRYELTGGSVSKDTITITAYTFVANAGGTISVMTTSSIAIQGQVGAKLLLFIGDSVIGLAMTQDPVKFGVYTYTAKGVAKAPASIKVMSRFGGSDSRTSPLRRSSQKVRQNA